LVSPGRAYERFMEGPKRNPFQVVFGFFGALIRWLIFIAAILLLIMIFTAGFNATSKGLTQTYATRLEVAITNNELLAPVYTGIKDVLKFTKDPTLIERQYGWRTSVDDNKDNLKLGLRFIRQFAPEQPRYETRDEILLSAGVEISSLKDNSYVKFSCNADEIPKEKISINYNQPVLIQKNEIKVLDVVCRIPASTLKIPEGRELSSQKVKLSAVYDFETTSTLGVYTMQQAYFDNLMNKGINPLENINDPNLDKNARQTIPEATYGPMQAVLGLSYSQPLTERNSAEDDTYNLRLKIQKSSSSWLGRLSKINQVYIYLPTNFELVDENFKEVQDLSVEELAEISGSKKYRLDDEKINGLNNQCNLYYKSDPQGCKDLFERGFIITTTKFRANSLEPSLVYDFIGAEIDYDFETETFASFTLVSQFV